MAEPRDLENRCHLPRSLHVPGKPVVLPNAWDVASTRAVVAAGYPVVATTSGGVTTSLGYEDQERAPACSGPFPPSSSAAANPTPSWITTQMGS
jgi:hypothetical protein